MKARWTRFSALLTATLGILIIALSIAFNQRFYPSYLYAYVCWTGISLGSLAILMVHYLTGGNWGMLVRRPLEAATAPLPLMALLFIPIALGLHELYIWSRPEIMSHDSLLREKFWYLNPPFFISRTAGYFVIWSGLMYWLNKWSLARNQSERAGRLEHLQRLSAGGLVLFVLTASFAAFDWIMTLTPEWYSTVFGLLVGISQALGAMALVVICVLLLSLREPVAEKTAPAQWQDLGNMLLMFILAWVYLLFMQFITVWIADLPEEVTWYQPRMETSWYLLGWVLVVVYFFVPFLMLLSRRAKRNRFALGFIATLILCAYWGDMFWLIMPAFREQGFELHWVDVGVFLGIGGLWLAVFLWRLSTRPVKPLTAARREALEHG